MTSEPCAFCEIVAGRAPAQVVHETATSILIIPHSPVTPGHILVIPRRHVADAADGPVVAGGAMIAAGIWAAENGVPFNLITSGGREATQTVFHLHIHYVPRKKGDGLQLPWTPCDGLHLEKYDEVWENWPDA